MREKAIEILMGRGYSEAEATEAVNEASEAELVELCNGETETQAVVVKPETVKKMNRSKVNTKPKAKIIPVKSAVDKANDIVSAERSEPFEVRKYGSIWVAKIVGRMSRARFNTELQKLRNLGGKFNKRYGGFVFDNDPSEALGVKQIGGEDEVIVEREGLALKAFDLYYSLPNPDDIASIWKKIACMSDEALNQFVTALSK